MRTEVERSLSSRSEPVASTCAYPCHPRPLLFFAVPPCFCGEPPKPSHGACMIHRPGYSRALSACLLAAALAGCDNPFKTYPADYGLRAAPEQLREVHPLKMDRFQA